MGVETGAGDGDWYLSEVDLPDPDAAIPDQGTRLNVGCFISIMRDAQLPTISSEGSRQTDICFAEASHFVSSDIFVNEDTSTIRDAP